MHPYAAEVLNQIKGSQYWEKEFHQAVTEVFESLSPVLDAEPRYRKLKILERLVNPERIITFRVPWEDDAGDVQINTGYRVEFSSILGPYKGGLRFHSTVTLDVLKSLAFEQTFKNALTGQAIGGGKGGSDFSIREKSEREIMRFCQSFMSELFRHIGPDTDVPAGDIGVGTREISYLFGQYRRLCNRFEGALTGKSLYAGGSLLRPEATGFGLVYFAQAMLNTKGESFEGKNVAISGFGNVAWGAATKVNHLGGKVITISGPDGFVHDPDGISGEKLEYMLEMRLSGRDVVQDYADKFKVKFYPGKRPWSTPCDVALPCATQGELELEDAKTLVKSGCKVVAEGANMPLTHEAIEHVRKAGVLYSPGKASNAGGVACSSLEMAQNSSRLYWTAEDVDAWLHKIMHNIHNTCLSVAEKYGRPSDYQFGANVAGFSRVAEATIEQGIV